MASTKITTSTIGFPRIGPKREMKTALEKYWKGQSSQNDLLATTQAVQAEAWRQQQDAGVELVGVDGTLYDQVLDTVFMLGVIPKRFQHLTGYDQYFAMARGALGSEALDMSKFFDTNYHFMVPELEDGWTPRPNFTHILDKIQRCQAVVGKAAAVPIVIGPLTFASLARGPGTSAPVMDIVNKLMPAYVALLEELRRLQVPEAQLHEPYLTTTQGAKLQAEAKAAYTALSAVNVPINLTTYYDDLGATYPWVITLPVAAISIDFLGCAGASVANQSLALLRTHGFPADKRLGAGIINARSVWADTGVAALLVRELLAAGVKHLSVQPSVPLQHLPLDVSVETQLDPSLRKRLGFAVQKLAEIASTKAEAEAILRAGTLQGDGDLSNFLPKDLPFDNVNAASFDRPEHFNVRRDKQIAMPAFPTTTIGSFPQTADVRRLRLQYKRGTISQQEYDAGIAAQIGFAIGVQEALGLDVFVHGESERTDMVEYFGQSLEGMWFSEQGWVQSYGSRYVRPPLIVGDIRFTKPMTVKEFKVAQSLTKAPVKGMLTGPVTILNWSFPRQDITRRSQAFQLGLAMRQEVKALEDAGCKVVQVDEPALREGLPLKAERWDAYLTWAVDAFRLCCAVAAPATQVVTHLCYSDFQDIMGAIDRMDADVLTIENSRSGDEMIRALAASHYSRDIGPGVYDVHSPVVPTVEFIKTKIRSFMATNILNGRTDRIWVNPDCGLKTRNWEETIPSMRNMVQAAAEMRAELASKGRVSGSAAAPQKGMGGVVPAPGQRVACSPCPCCQ